MRWQILSPNVTLPMCRGCPKWVESVPLGFPTDEVHLPTLPHRLAELQRKCSLTPHPAFRGVTVPFSGGFALLCSDLPCLKAGPGEPASGDLLERFQPKSWAGAVLPF